VTKTELNVVPVGSASLRTHSPPNQLRDPDGNPNAQH